MLPNAQTPLGRVLRLPLKLIPRNTVVPVLSGLNQGLLWRASSSVHSAWIGSFERAKQAVVAETVEPHMVAFDVGAQAGFYTLALARRCARVIAFEPVPENVDALRFHVDANRLSNVTVQPVAVGRASGTARFRLGPNRLMGSLSRDGELTVQVVTLDALGIVPDLVKVDVEGAEFEVLSGARDLIAERRTTWLVALDDPARREETLSLLADYRLHEFAAGEIIARP